MQWYKRFGYEKNPFELNPLKAPYTVIHNKELIADLLYLVRVGSMVVVEGAQGSGKTTLLTRVINLFKGEGKAVYIDGNKIPDELDIEDVLNKKGRGIIRGLFNDKPKGMILLLDNVHSISSRNCEKIKYYFDQNYIRSVVFTTETYSKLKLDRSIHDRIMGQVIQIAPYSKFDVLRVVRDRFLDDDFLGDDMILSIARISDHNVKDALANTSKLCEHVTKEGRGEVLPKYLPLINKKPTRKVKRTVTLRSVPKQSNASLRLAASAKEQKVNA
ncbi:MAG: Cdc6-like AAA superfamily ATPase [Candidatus Woesearchaeota archaeon]|jgi:Cdc6-like AAA superfamily ATPase